MNTPSQSLAQRRSIIGILSFTQVVSWGSLYYAFALLAADMQREFGWRTEVIFGAFSWSLLIAGLASTPAGILLDRYGGRPVMGTGSLLAGAGMVTLGMTHSLAGYVAAWTLLGLAMAMVLYEAAFATINREFVHDARQGISIVTLSGGLASTVFWPLTLMLKHHFGWRETCLIYAAAHLLLCAPLHALLPASARRVVARAAESIARNYTLQEAVRHPVFWKLAFAFAANTFIFAALSVHLIPTLQRFGHPLAASVFMATLIGPMQVAGRIAEMAFASRVRPQAVGKLTFAILPAALLTVIFLGQHQAAAAAFCMLYGVSNGVLTIVRGTVPQALFGRQNYGAISGALAGPSLAAKAIGPLAVAAFVEATPSPRWLLAMLLVVSLASLWSYLAAVKVPQEEAELKVAQD
ncbi:MFS transporter [Noviherbaspirillum massiliense]|uniref:MFS transporter n=1 Tax=Noviherbaspirillum massiliense TaxID=1465823 RepID=UPI00030B620B|nr:MFS transporter [Noviherbaspirillum massiliense]